MNIITPNWPAPVNIRAFTTTRTSWGDNIGGIGTITPEEGDRLRTLLSLPSDPVWIQQTHSVTAVAAEISYDNQPADASYTGEPDQVCVVLTADCLPILICDSQGTQVAAIHAGWRGLANGIVENTVHAMLKNPATTSDLMAWMGPAIGPEKFEVGADVYHAFTDNDPDCKPCFTPGAPGKWLANLFKLAARRLNKLGITSVFGGEYCTHTQQDLFYSYRRDGSSTGRMASLIWIDAP